MYCHINNKLQIIIDKKVSSIGNCIIYVYYVYFIKSYLFLLAYIFFLLNYINFIIQLSIKKKENYDFLKELSIVHVNKLIQWRQTILEILEKIFYIQPSIRFTITFYITINETKSTNSLDNHQFKLWRIKSNSHNIFTNIINVILAKKLFLKSWKLNKVY